MPIRIPNYLEQPDRQLQLSPAQLMSEAAEGLTSRMQGKVRAAVFTLNPGGSTLFRHTFYLIVPAADDYTDPLFYVWHNPELYPAQVLLAGGRRDKDEISCKNSEELSDKIQLIFERPETGQLMLALADLAESRSSQNQGGRRNWP